MIPDRPGIPPPTPRPARRPMYANKPNRMRNGRRLTRIVTRMFDPDPFPWMSTLCARSCWARLVSCSATGICDVYCVPLFRVPLTAPFASMVAVFTWSALTLSRNWL